MEQRSRARGDDLVIKQGAPEHSTREAMTTAYAVPSSMQRSHEIDDRDARLRQMVDHHFDFIWRSLRGLGVSPAAVDDAAQQVFLIASRKLDAIALGSERGFLFSTARGIAANFRRGQRRSPEVADDLALAGQHDVAPNPEQAASSNQAKAWLERFLEDLPQDLRTVFVLYELEGLTTTEIADLSDMPTGTVASKLRRAREAFHDAIKRLRAREERTIR